MTTFILSQAAKFLTLILRSDSFVRVFTVDEQKSIRNALEAIGSALHYKG
jgi:transposase-like protein